MHDSGRYARRVQRTIRTAGELRHQPEICGQMVHARYSGIDLVRRRIQFVLCVHMLVRKGQDGRQLRHEVVAVYNSIALRDGSVIGTGKNVVSGARASISVDGGRPARRIQSDIQSQQGYQRPAQAMAADRNAGSRFCIEIALDRVLRG